MIYPQNGFTILCLDPSGSSIGWCIAKLKDGKFIITNAGALQASSSWDLGQRLSYMQKGVKFLIEYFNVNFIVSEEAVINPRMAGAAVVPTIVNNLKMLIWDMGVAGHKLDLQLINVNTWHKTLGISGIPAVDKKGQLILNARGKPKKDYKTPTAQKVKEMLKITLPAQVLDNRSLKLKKMPNDITDCLAISIAYAISLHYPWIEAFPDCFDNAETIHCVKILYTLKK